MGHRASKSLVVKVVLAIIIGCLGASILISAFEFSTKIGIVVAAGICTIPILLMIKPYIAYCGFILCILLIEEFPGVNGETLERSIRTPFYSMSVGVPGVYPVDALLFFVIAVYLLYVLIKKKSLYWTFDSITISVLLICGSLFVTSLISLVFANPLADIVLDSSSGLGFAMNQRGLNLVGVLQVKNFLSIMWAYWLGLQMFDSKEQVQKFIRVFAIFCVLDICYGVFTTIRHTEVITHSIPLFYHSPTSWLFGLVIYFAILSWAFKLLSGNKLFYFVSICIFLAFFILISYRRTLWTALFICTLILMLFLPPKQRIKFLLISGVFVIGIFGIIMITPLGQDVLHSVVNRLMQTNEKDASSLYRYALFVHFLRYATEIPFFGYGLKPLWNMPVVLGYFRMNLECIHSLYFWIFLRAGYFGILSSGVALVLIVQKNILLALNLKDTQLRILSIVIFMALLILLFSGIFNPVYAEIRYMVMMATGLALLVRMEQMDHETKNIG